MKALQTESALSQYFWELDSDGLRGPIASCIRLSKFLGTMESHMNSIVIIYRNDPALAFIQQAIGPQR
ncbi:hypothetical protein BC629DRAFT_1071879 [Irpex lacteus]|nr:hypothetical protein BC629DRAFT_1071879 [Irpex lacteus]